MVINRYKKQIIPLIITVLIVVIAFIGPFINPSDSESDRITLLLPDWGLLFQIFAIFSLLIFATIIGSFFPGYIFGPLFLYVYKKTIGIKMIFGIQEREIPLKFKYTLRNFFPSLMVINFAVIFSGFQWISDICVNPSYPDVARVPFMTFIVLLPLLSGIVSGLFSAPWILLDAGIVFTNKDRVLDKINPIEVRSMGGWYLYILKGYAGIGAIWAFITFLSNTILNYGSSDAVIPVIILIPILPIIYLYLGVPAMIVLDKTVNHRRDYMRRFAKRLGISETLEDPLDLRIND